MPVFNATNPVSIGAATKKDHFDRAFDNILVLRDGGIAMAGQAAGGEDVVLSSNASQLKVLAMGLAQQVLRVNTAGTALEFGPGAPRYFKDPMVVGRTRFVGV